jgi:hypothetical protein
MFNPSYIYVKRTIYFNIPTNNYSYTHRTTTVNAERINRNTNWSVSVTANDFFLSQSPTVETDSWKWVVRVLAAHYRHHEFIVAHLLY